MRYSVTIDASCRPGPRLKLLVAWLKIVEAEHNPLLEPPANEAALSLTVMLAELKGISLQTRMPRDS